LVLPPAAPSRWRCAPTLLLLPNAAACLIPCTALRAPATLRCVPFAGSAAPRLPFAGCKLSVAGLIRYARLHAPAAFLYECRVRALRLHVAAQPLPLRAAAAPHGSLCCPGLPPPSSSGFAVATALTRRAALPHTACLTPPRCTAPRCTLPAPHCVPTHWMGQTPPAARTHAVVTSTPLAHRLLLLPLPPPHLPLPHAACRCTATHPLVAPPLHAATATCACALHLARPLRCTTPALHTAPVCACAAGRGAAFLPVTLRVQFYGWFAAWHGIPFPPTSSPTTD